MKRRNLFEIYYDQDSHSVAAGFGFRCDFDDVGGKPLRR